MKSELPSKMKAIQLQEPGKMVLTELPLPKPTSNELLIKTKAATICTSDLHDIDRDVYKRQIQLSYRTQYITGCKNTVIPIIKKIYGRAVPY